MTSSPSSSRWSTGELESRLHKAWQWLEECTAPLIKEHFESNGLNESNDKTNKHSPWSRSDYLERCASFSWTWAGRPAPVDPMTCSLYGWMSDARNPQVITCVGCRAQLYLPWDEESMEDDEARAIISREYSQKITIDGHKSGCPWQLCPADGSLVHAQYNGSLVEGDLLLKRYNSFIDCDVHVTPNRMSYDGLFENFPRKNHLQMALLQWQHISTSHGLGTISCRFGCSVYPVSEGQNFHPEENHLYYCPFIQGGGLETFLKIFHGRDGRSTDYYPLLTSFTVRQIEELLPNEQQLNC